VESEPGNGATFFVYLPVAKKRVERSRAVDESLPSGTERILLVDDEPPIVKSGSQMLERLGYRVTALTDSGEALRRFRERTHGFDLVITDMTMPQMTGDTLAREMLRVRPDIPVILCTGYTRRISDETAADIGIRACLNKPIVKADLARTVRNVLDEKKTNDSQ
jgi:CheY-like chemotaxis protein